MITLLNLALFIFVVLSLLWWGFLIKKCPPRISKLRRAYYDWQDRQYEKSIGCDFGGIIHHSDLKLTAAGGEYGNSYQAAWTRNIRVLLNQALKLNAYPQNFIDIGSGKGKVCIYAALHPQLVCSQTQVVGIELDSQLLAASKHNITNLTKRLGAAGKLYKFASIRCERADALTYKLPQGKSIIFIFNSLRGEGFTKMMKNFAAQMGPHDLICYANDVERQTMLNLGFKEHYSDRKFKLSVWSH